jgi:acyl-CoA reductase-like NAD-dependent aldehyde dehydrogenase
MWRRIPQAERSATLRELAGAVEAAAHELADLNSRETGRLFDDALAGVRAGAEALRRYAELSLLRSGPSLAGAFSGLDFTVFEPRGVVLGLTSWDDPVATACGIAGAGLAAGNVVVLKPSERCPSLGRRLGRLFASAVPPGVLSTVTGDAEFGAALAHDDRVDAVVHVGTAAVADSLAEASCRTGAHLVRGRGGTNSLIVDRGVDLGWAAACTAQSAFRHAGQLLSATRKVFVLDEVEEPFLDHLAEQARQWADPEKVGPLVDEWVRGDLDRAVREALDGGAAALAGASLPEGPGCFYPPTVLARCSPAARIVREQVRGPVAAVMAVRTFDEAIAEAAEQPCGASATVLTRDIGHAQIAAAEIPVASVVVNGVALGAAATDVPGLPQTGGTAAFGPRLLDELSRPKVIHLEPPVAARGLGRGGY